MKLITWNAQWFDGLGDFDVLLKPNDLWTAVRGPNEVLSLAGSVTRDGAHSPMAISDNVGYRKVATASAADKEIMSYGH